MSKVTFLMVPVNANGALVGVGAVDDAAVGLFGVDPPGQV